MIARMADEERDRVLTGSGRHIVVYTYRLKIKTTSACITPRRWYLQKPSGQLRRGQLRSPEHALCGVSISSEKLITIAYQKEAC